MKGYCFCRIPERVFHARGAAAKGYFELTHDISHLTSAALFNGVGKKTPVAVRFSTATNERGSPESEPLIFATRLLQQYQL